MQSVMPNYGIFMSKSNPIKRYNSQSLFCDDNNTNDQETISTMVPVILFFTVVYLNEEKNNNCSNPGTIKVEKGKKKTLKCSKVSGRARIGGKYG